MMSLLKKILSLKNGIRVPVEAAALLLIGFSHLSAASTGPSWSNKPNWAAPDSSGPSPVRPSSRKNSPLLESRYSDVSPFSPGSNNVSLDLGQVFLMGDLGNNYTDNIGAQIHYTYGVSDLFGFDTSMGYSDHADGKFSMFSALAGVRMNLSWYDKVIPYATFGMGFYRPSHPVTVMRKDDPSVVERFDSISPLLFGVHLGPGVDLELTKQMFFGAALTFHDVFGNPRVDQNGKLLNVGGTYTTFFVRAGVTF